jgi:putative ABC transport system permease protein
VLLIACANLANLLLARGLGTRQQSSVRVALGASRVRMVRKALVESVTLGLLGGMAGLLVAYGGTSLILYMAFPATTNHVPIDAAPSWPVLLFALAVSVATGIGFGVAPAWLASRAQPIDALRGANRSTGGRTSLPQKALVVTQAALSLVLLSAAIMLSQSMSNMVHQNFGFDMKDRYVAWVDPMMAGYQPEQLENLYERIEQRMQQIPGVQKDAVAAYAPMSGDNWSTTVRIEGKPEPHINDKTNAGFLRAMPGFFETLGIPVLMGRPFTDEDTPSSQNVVVINEALAKQFFKNENPIGKHFGTGANMKHSGDYEIVGVVANTRFPDFDIKEPLGPMFFLPENQSVHYDKPDEINGERHTHFLSQIIFWAPGCHSGLEMRVRRALAEVDPNLTVADIRNYDEMLRYDFSQEMLIARLTSLFGALALVLAAVGLYGVTAYNVEQRTNEIGIRMALGADRISVVKMVLRSAFLQVAIGLAIGIPAAIGAGYGMANQLYSVKPWSPVVLAIATALLGLAALIASLVPSQKAASVEPMQALRNE